MDIQNIDGATRTIGESQGYIPLPVRDVFLTDAATGLYTPAMQTSWMPTSEEMARLRAGHPIRLTILGNSHPPVIMEVDEPVWPIIDAEFEVIS